MIRAILVFNNYGKPRLLKFYEYFPEEEQQQIVRETYQLVSKRDENVCNFLEGGELIGGSEYRLIYRHYATLYFILCVDSCESELGILDLIQVFVETLDRCFENVCELDLIFHVDKVHFILNELVMGGMVLETNMNEILTRVQEQDKMEKHEVLHRLQSSMSASTTLLSTKPSVDGEEELDYNEGMDHVEDGEAEPSPLASPPVVEDGETDDCEEGEVQDSDDEEATQKALEAAQAKAKAANAPRPLIEAPEIDDYPPPMMTGGYPMVMPYMDGPPPGYLPYPQQRTYLPKQEVPCKFYNRGACAKGDDCQFLHNPALVEPQPSYRQYPPGAPGPYGMPPLQPLLPELGNGTHAPYLDERRGSHGRSRRRVSSTSSDSSEDMPPAHRRDRGTRHVQPQSIVISPPPRRGHALPSQNDARPRSSNGRDRERERDRRPALITGDSRKERRTYEGPPERRAIPRRRTRSRSPIDRRRRATPTKRRRSRSKSPGRRDEFGRDRRNSPPARRGRQRSGGSSNDSRRRRAAKRTSSTSSSSSSDDSFKNNAAQLAEEFDRKRRASGASRNGADKVSSADSSPASRQRSGPRTPLGSPPPVSIPDYQAEYRNQSAATTTSSDETEENSAKDPSREELLNKLHTIEEMINKTKKKTKQAMLPK